MPANTRKRAARCSRCTSTCEPHGRRDRWMWGHTPETGRTLRCQGAARKRADSAEGCTALRPRPTCELWPRYGASWPRTPLVGYVSAINRSGSATETTAMVGRVVIFSMTQWRISVVAGMPRAVACAPARHGLSDSGTEIVTTLSQLGANTARFTGGRGGTIPHWSAQFRDQPLTPETTAGLTGGQVVQAHSA
jgi:hypothetical protein